MLDGTPARAAAPPPKRYLVTFGGLSTGNPEPDRAQHGRRQLRPQALARAARSNVKNEVSVVSGLRLPQNGAGRMDRALALAAASAR